MKRISIAAVLTTSTLLGFAATALAEDVTYTTEKDILYRTSEITSADDLTDDMRAMCRLDLYYPKGAKDFITVIWLHPGGLTGGSRYVPERLKEQGVAVVAVDYRLSPKVKAPAYIEDAAAAVAWTFKNIEKYGGSTERIVLAGYLAGGYLTLMLGLDKSWLAKYDIDVDRLLGLVSFSGHAITHFTVRQERGIPGTQPIIDKLAPLYYVRKDAPPLLLITGDRELEMLGRYEENAYLARMMKVAGHTQTKLLELDGHNHGEMERPAQGLLLKYLKRLQKELKAGN